MSHDANVSLSFVATSKEIREHILGMLAVCTDSCSHLLMLGPIVLHAWKRVTTNLLIDYDVYLDTLSCLTSEQIIQPPSRIVVCRSSQMQLRTQPPVFNVDAFLCVHQCRANSPKVVSAIDIPLDVVSNRLLREAAVTVRRRDLAAPVVNLLLVGLIVAVVWVEDVGELSPGISCVGEPNLDGVEVRMLAVAAHARETALGVLGSAMTVRGRHVTLREIEMMDST